MENSFYRFPAMAKLDEWTNGEQMTAIIKERREADEALEILEAVSPYTAPEDIALRRREYGMELIDIIHATETALRMEFTDEEVAELRDAVEKKNRDRGYYAARDADGVDTKVGDTIYSIKGSDPLTVAKMTNK